MNNTLARIARPLGWVALAVPALAVGIALGRNLPTALDAPFAPISEALEGTPVVSTVAHAAGQLVNEVERGLHLGFDTSDYPGDAAMVAWAEHAPYSWVGYYLPAPCHKDASWSGKRERLEQMGWGIALVYVGQQQWEKSRTVRGRTPTCATQLLSERQGVKEAEDAITKTAAEGFPEGTTIFLDIERMERMSKAMRDYYTGWVVRVLEDGRFVPGVYAHTHNAKAIYTDVKAAYVAAGIGDEPPFWIASGRGFNEDRAPTEVGHQFANVWQGRLDIEQRWSNVRLPIDVNVSDTRSPSLALAGARRAATLEVVAGD